MQIEAFSGQWAVANPGANSTAGSLVDPLPTATRPDLAAVSSGVTTIGDGVIPLVPSGGAGPVRQACLLAFYGAGSNGNAFNANLFGWRVLPSLAGALGALGKTDLWVPVLLATFTSVTLDSTLPGVVNTQLGTTQLFCNAITLGVGNSNYTVEVLSPGGSNHRVAHVVAATKGFRFLELRYSIGTATSCNALWSLL